MRQQDVLHSLSLYLHDRFNSGGAKIPIYTHRNPERIVADRQLRQREDRYFGVCILNNQDWQLALGLTINDDQWCILYCGKNEQDVRGTISDIAQNISVRSSLPGILYQYEMPTPHVTSAGNGVYEISVRGRQYSIFGDEQPERPYRSLPSSSVRLEDNMDGTIRFPCVPNERSAFSHYEVLVREYTEEDDEEDDLWYCLTDEFIEHEHINLPQMYSFEYTDIEAAVNNPIKDAISIKTETIDTCPYIYFRSLQIISVESDMVENVIEEGFWVGYVNIKIQSPAFYYSEEEDAGFIECIQFRLGVGEDNDERPDQLFDIRRESDGNVYSVTT